MATTSRFRTDAKINWYRCKVDKAAMSALMQTSDWHGYRQAVGHIGLWFVTGTLAYLAFARISAANWLWSVPLLLAALFAHGTVGSFLGGTACHELSHKTPFKTKSVNEFFLKLYAFFGWWDHVWYRPSHIKHHQLTVYHDYDGEVVLPLKFNFQSVETWLGLLAWNPHGTWILLKTVFRRATGHMDNDWFEFVLPESNERLRPGAALSLGAGYPPRSCGARCGVHRDRALVPDCCLQSRLAILRLAVVPVRRAATLRFVARCARPPPILPHLQLFVVAGVSVLEHAISRRTPHVPRRTVPQPAETPQTDRTRFAARAAWIACALETHAGSAPQADG